MERGQFGGSEYCKNYERVPVVNQVMMTVVWMEGSYTSSWRPRRERERKTRKSIGLIVSPKLSMLLLGFALTALKHLWK